jgi:hypothetical protein
MPGIHGGPAHQTRVQRRASGCSPLLKERLLGPQCKRMSLKFKGRCDTSVVGQKIPQGSFQRSLLLRVCYAVTDFED